MAFTQIEVTQDYTLADGTEPTGSVTFTPSAAMLNGTAVVAATPMTVRLNGAGTATADLVANTDPGTTPAATTYRVVELINDRSRSYTVRVPHDQGSPLTLYSLVVT